MHFITGKHMPRRTFIRGAMGAAVALPFLDAMVAAKGAGQKAAAAAEAISNTSTSAPRTYLRMRIVDLSG